MSRPTPARSPLLLLAAGLAGLFLFLTLASLVLMFAWARTLSKRTSQELTHQVLRVKDAQSADGLRARLFAESGLDALRVELEEAAGGAAPPASPYVLSLGETYAGAGDLVQVDFEPAADEGWTVTARGRVLAHWDVAGASVLDAIAEHELRATVSEDGEHVQIHTSREVSLPMKRAETLSDRDD